VLPAGRLHYGAAQLVQRVGDHYAAASDGRRGGQAVGYLRGRRGQTSKPFATSSRHAVSSRIPCVGG
jgi:hypothetical protein